jgi:hypothetical protein
LQRRNRKLTAMLTIPPVTRNGNPNMRYSLTAALAAVAVAASSPAMADIVQVDPSTIQGTLVHNDGAEVTSAEPVAQLGINSGVGVHFTGTTAGDPDLLRLQNGQGQAEITGAEITSGGTPNDTYAINSLNIFLDNHDLYDFIELSLFGTGTVNFTLTDDAGTNFFFSGLLGTGENKFGFEAINGQSISNLLFNVTGGSVTNVRQVRIGQNAAAVPEPATWAMMLLGFGAVGYSTRRRRKSVLTQIA